ncbi:RHS repeat-associated core domain-containing protein [Gordonia sp. IEGM753]
MTDFGGDIAWSAKYNAYGKVSRLQHGVGEQLEHPLRFQGQYFDRESGLHHNRHRYYNPDVGRYLTPDPIKLAGGLNQYQYTPNPTGWVDPLGLACGPCPGEIEANGPFSVLAPGGGLSAHEARGGHLIEKHIGRTEAQLRQRLRGEPNIPIASTFPNQATAEAAVFNTVKQNKTLIDEFLNSRTRKLVITQQMTTPIGVGVVRNTGKLESLDFVKLILKKQSTSRSEYFILTGYASDRQIIQ